MTGLLAHKYHNVRSNFFRDSLAFFGLIINFSREQEVHENLSD